MFTISVALLFLFSFLPLASGTSLHYVSLNRNNVVNCPTASCSSNWSGYAVTSSSGSVSDVKGSWIVPKATCTSHATYSSIWTGIDGYKSNTVEQTGTDSDCSSGRAHYYAWYEFYPSGSVKISGISVKPGDKITAEVSYSSNTRLFSVKISDGSQTFSTSKVVPGAARSSAEWIAERPALCSGSFCRLTSLTNFGTVQFGNQYTGSSGTNYATVNGIAGQISAFSHVAITMVDSSGKVLSDPSALTDGTSFSVAWHASS